MRDLLGVVLCGGRSSRMGRDKAALPHPDGTTYVHHAIERMHEVCAQVCVAGQCAIPVEVPVLKDIIAHQGPMTGILNALLHAAEQGLHACLVTPVDMPRLSAQDLVRFRDTWCAYHTICVGRDTKSRQIQPLVAVYPVTVTDALASYAERDRSLAGWLAKQSVKEVMLSANACHNVNTPDDLVR